ncbi:MAG TPA: YbfB/YjiJ family MFS transporter [Candidatus Bathyarchaeia archaeon]|nr:YbfB/YjiJ family MFS transporter [Candidatus Bathyarchaeia archaeon]
MAAAVGIGRFVYTPILPLMVEDLGMTKGTAGLIASANFAGYLAGALAAALPGLPGSRRRWLIVALAMSALTTAAMAIPSASAAFLALRFVGGIASAFGLVFSSALVLDRLSAAGRPGLAAIHFAGVGTGILISAILATALSARGWRVLWVAAGVVSMIAVAIVAAVIPDRPGLVATESPRASSGGPSLAGLVVAYGLFGFGYIITATFLVAIVRGSSEVKAVEPVVWMVVGLTAAPSVAVWTFIESRIGIERAFALACAVEAIGVAASVVWLEPVGILLAAALLGATFMGITALGLIWGRRLAQGDPRKILAVLTAAFGVGQIIAPTLAGVTYDATGSFLPSSLAAATALMVAALLALRRRASPAS